MKDNNTLFIVLGAVVVGAVGFFAGRHTTFGFGNRWGMQAGYGPVTVEKRAGMMAGPMMGGGFAGKGGRFGRGMM